MKKMLALNIFFLLLLSFKTKENKVICTSPNGAIAVSVEVNDTGNCDFTVVLNRDTIIKNTPVGISLKDENFRFDGNLSLVKVNTSIIDEPYQMKTGKQLMRSNHCNQTEIVLKNSSNKLVSVVFRAYDDGIAYRYQLSNADSGVVQDESSAFNFDDIEKVWSVPYVPYEEKLWDKGQPVAGIQRTNLSFPILVNTKANSWALVSESNVSNYPLSIGFFNNNQLKYAFAPEETGKNNIGPGFVSPWRVIILGKKLNSVVESCLVDHLATPSTIKDVSWIKPGVTSFPWWGDNYANSTPGGIKKYIDLSAKMNWKYVEFDIALIGSPTVAVDKWKSVNWIKVVTDYGKLKGVACYGWDDILNLDTPEKRNDIFTRYNNLGLAGIKVDFISSYSQYTRQLLEDLLQDAARHKLLVSFHGAQSPRGFARKYPNLMTIEAVHGGEYYLAVNGSKGNTPRHNCTLPFTRNVLGSMDYTPVAFSSKIRTTTMAHELALSVIFESGWQGISDTPEALLNSVAKPFLSQLTSTWDETRLLDGYPGEYCCMARRKGNTWFIAGINAGKERRVSLNLPITNIQNIPVYTDVKNDLNSLGIINCSVSPGKPLELTMRENGGFAFIIKN